MHAPPRSAWIKLRAHAWISLIGLWAMTSARALAADDEQGVNKLQGFAASRLLAGAEPSGAKDRHQEVFEAVWKTVDENFYDPHFVGVDWRAVGQQYRSRVADVKDDAALLALLTQMLKILPVSHLRLAPPEPQRPGAVAVQAHMVEGQRVITAVAPASDAQRQGLRIGDVILTPLDMLRGPVGSIASVRVKDFHGGERSLEVRREGAWWPPERPSLRWRTIERRPGERIGYLRAIRFDDDVAPEVDAAMHDVRDTVGLIIDVRNNGGGNISFIRLCSYLTPGRNFVTGLATRPFLERHQPDLNHLEPTTLPKAVAAYTDAKVFAAMRTNGGAAAFYTEDVGDRVYRGRVVVLLDEQTGSAAEGFTWYMKRKSKATLIGRPTQGAILGGETFSLRGGWRLTVPTHVALGPDGKLFKDTPTTPHILVRWSLRDVCEGRDPDIAKALDVLEGN